MVTTKVQRVRDKLQLSRLQDAKLDPSSVLYALQIGLNELTLKDLSKEPIYNSFSSGMRSFQSNLISYIDKDQRIYIRTIQEEIEEAQTIREKAKLQYYIYDLLNLIRDSKVAEINYSTYEGKRPGAVSHWIHQRVSAEIDRNVIFGIFGDTGSGKSETGYRLGLNSALLTGAQFDLQDISYSYDAFLERIDQRKEDGTLKGSIQILDEGGNVVDSQSWFEEDVKDAVRVLRTNRYQNTCTIIISPNYTDIAKRARGLFHAWMIPWKEWGLRYVDLTDKANIDYDRGISSWKMDLADVDPMTGDVYPGKLKAALGNIRKVDCLKIPKGMSTKYKTKSNTYKDKLQKTQLKKRGIKKARASPGEFRDECTKYVLKNRREFASISKRGHALDWKRIKNKWEHIGEPTAKMIRDNALRTIKEQSKKRAKKVQEKIENENKHTSSQGTQEPQAP